MTRPRVANIWQEGQPHRPRPTVANAFAQVSPIMPTMTTNSR